MPVNPVNEVPRIRVAAAIIRRGDRYLLTLRGPRQHGAGHWEFPGGKLEPGESAPEALVRELQEEIGVTVTAGALFHRIEHRYEDRHVELLFHHATLAEGGDEPRALEVAGLGWYVPREMPGLPILPADLPVVDALAALDGPDERDGLDGLDAPDAPDAPDRLDAPGVPDRLDAVDGLDAPDAPDAEESAP